MRSLVGLSLLVSLFRLGSTAEWTSSDWPQFRGPGGTGHTASTNLPTNWGSFLEPYTWRTLIPGRGWSSPIAIGNRIWLTTAESTAIAESPSNQDLLESQPDLVDFKSHASVTFYAIELDAETGQIVGQLELFSSDHPPPIHATNSYASPTPVTDGTTLICHFGSLGTVGIDLESRAILWKQIIAVDDITGSGSSPIMVGERLIIPCDGADQQFVIAVEKRSGRTLWKSARPPIEAKESFMRRAFSTPLVVEDQKHLQVIVPAAQSVGIL